MENAKVMIVDDDKAFLDELGEILLMSGYDVVAVGNGHPVVEVARREKPRLIVLDLKMRGTNGVEAAAKLHRTVDTAHIPIIAMTGFFTKEEAEELLGGCSVKKCLFKPFNPLDVIAHVEMLLKQK